ncbi:MAG: hypothetical protein QM817_35235 [Archangium sp.]
MRLLLLAAEPSPHDFNPVRENLGMAAMAVIVLVAWLAYRKMIELSRRKAAAEKTQEK